MYDSLFLCFRGQGSASKELNIQIHNNIATKGAFMLSVNIQTIFNTSVDVTVCIPYNYTFR